MLTIAGESALISSLADRASQPLEAGSLEGFKYDLARAVDSFSGEPVYQHLAKEPMGATVYWRGHGQDCIDLAVLDSDGVFWFGTLGAKVATAFPTTLEVALTPPHAWERNVLAVGVPIAMYLATTVLPPALGGPAAAVEPFAAACVTYFTSIGINYGAIRWEDYCRNWTRDSLRTDYHDKMAVGGDAVRLMFQTQSR